MLSISWDLCQVFSSTFSFLAVFPGYTDPGSLFVQGNLVAVGTHKGFVQIWDAAAGKKLSMLEGHTARVGKEWGSRGFSGISPS